MAGSPESNAYERAKIELGGLVRKLRSEAGVTGSALAKASGFSQSKISKIETGRIAASLRDIEIIATTLHLPAQVAAELLERADALQTDVSSWRLLLREGLAQGQRDIREVERQHDRQRVFQTGVVPGLLQTPEYARNLMMTYPEAAEGDIARAISERVTRQSVLYDPSKNFDFVLLESVLYNRFGSPAVMRAQVDWLRIASSIDQVRFGIIPLGSDLPVVPLNPFVIFGDDLVIVETMTAEMSITSPSSLRVYMQMFDDLSKKAKRGDLLLRVLDHAAKFYSEMTK